MSLFDGWPLDMGHKGLALAYLQYLFTWSGARIILSWKEAQLFLSSSPSKLSNSELYVSSAWLAETKDVEWA
nr:hypothetical protein Iba_chr06cCG5760 [Ipomoea batatas]